MIALRTLSCMAILGLGLAFATPSWAETPPPPQGATKVEQTAPQAARGMRRELTEEQKAQRQERRKAFQAMREEGRALHERVDKTVAALSAHRAALKAGSPSPELLTKIDHDLAELESEHAAMQAMHERMKAMHPKGERGERRPMMGMEKPTAPPTASVAPVK